LPKNLPHVSAELLAYDIGQEQIIKILGPP